MEAWNDLVICTELWGSGGTHGAQTCGTGRLRLMSESACDENAARVGTDGAQISGTGQIRLMSETPCDKNAWPWPAPCANWVALRHLILGCLGRNTRQRVS